ncbi:(2Fe-2S)-binding protein [Thermosediminibacter litoriperuensis]|uniref:Carbon-monoxide dehydrogenase small subunit n=1 Tax=Thermosediminibacter litoriperuensis TaxID=291989 RepID=A0A5S5AM16_9FIRM|nr:(2Fe-2S)-binding protein [Thermosediminibacter litoriperuensis]TYP51598.1 carbon-monoxide dehydrogenase small subunit [Thermosediminibacter litoriperuensis]
MEIVLYVNGKKYKLDVGSEERLLDVLRDKIGIKSVREGCSEGECGACTVLMDKKPVTSCLVLAFQAEGKEILTVEGLIENGELDQLQKSFIEKGAIQCGYCTPGMILSIKGLLYQNPNPTEEEIREAIAGNLCRCTGYKKIVDAVIDAVQKGEERCVRTRQ